MAARCPLAAHGAGSGLTEPVDTDTSPPTFDCRNITATGLDLHYYSRRQGLTPFVVGAVLALGRVYCGCEASVHLVASREAGDCDHEVFRVTYPTCEQVVSRLTLFSDPKF